MRFPLSFLSTAVILPSILNTTLFFLEAHDSKCACVSQCPLRNLTCQPTADPDCKNYFSICYLKTETEQSSAMRAIQIFCSVLQIVHYRNTVALWAEESSMHVSV